MKNNELLEAHKNRFACKKFDTEKKISNEDFDYILEVGRLSPSSFGWEAWKFVVVQNMDLREKLKEVSWGAQTQLPTASHFVLILARREGSFKKDSDYLKYISEEIKQFPRDVVKMRSDFFEKFKKNDFDLTDERKLFDWASKQAYLPFANMMTAAAFIGVDSCPIEGFNRDKIEEILKNESQINIADFGVVAMVAFGYRADDSSIYPKTRRAISEVVEWIK